MANSKRPVSIAMADLESRLPKEMFLHLAGPQPVMLSDTDDLDFDEGRALACIMSSRRYHILQPGEKKRETGWDESLTLRASRGFKSELAPDEDLFTLAGEVNFQPVTPGSTRMIEPIALAVLTGEKSKDKKHLHVNEVNVGTETMAATPKRVDAAFDVLSVCKHYIAASRKTKVPPPDYLDLCSSFMRKAFPGKTNRLMTVIKTMRYNLANDKT